jgi:tripartite-type tricarboxylate transporter receptor subunit TctC
LTITAAAIVSFGCASHADAQTTTYPSRPIRIVVGFPPASSTDTVARAVGEHLRLKFGQPVVVDNRPGANGVLGVSEAAKSTPDGYTLLATNSSSITVNPQIYRKISYLPERDFVPLTMAISAPFILTVNAVHDRTAGVNSVADLVKLARSRPGQLTYGSGGLGNLAHLGFEMINNRAGITSVHVPYKSGNAALAAVLAREIDMMLTTPSAVPHMTAGRLKALAVSTSSRWHELPNTPTMIEAGYPNFDVPFWLGLLVPSKTPPAIIQTLYDTILTMRDDAAATKPLRAMGTVELIDPKTFAARIRAETAAWGEIIKREKILLD